MLQDKSENYWLQADINTITFGKDRYHEHGRMEYWCQKNIGEGLWSYAIPKTWEGMNGKVWIIHSMSGNTTFKFKNEKDYIWFVLRWT